MSCGPCGPFNGSCNPCGPIRSNFIPRCAVFSILNRVFCEICCNHKRKEEKACCFTNAVRALARFSTDGNGYSFVQGLKSADPSVFLFLYIDNVRADFNPNLGMHDILQIALVVYGDNGICRTLVHRHKVIAANATELTGDSPVDGTVAQKLFNGNFNTVLPIGFTNPYPQSAPFGLAASGIIPGPGIIGDGGPGFVGGDFGLI